MRQSIGQGLVLAWRHLGGLSGLSQRGDQALRLLWFGGEPRNGMEHLHLGDQLRGLHIAGIVLSATGRDWRLLPRFAQEPAEELQSLRVAPRLGVHHAGALLEVAF